MNNEMHKVTMNKHRATWHWFHENPQGGGFGSNHCGSKKVALHKATFTIKPGEQYELIVNGKRQGVKTKEQL